MHNKGNNDVDKESLSASIISKLQMNHHENGFHLPLDSFQYFHIDYNHF
jgi:hypothetical protein